VPASLWQSALVDWFGVVIAMLEDHTVALSSAAATTHKFLSEKVFFFSE
jgi:hypothetical protein